MNKSSSRVQPSRTLLKKCYSLNGRLESIAIFLMLLVVFLNPFPHTTFLDQLFFYAAILPMIAMVRTNHNGFYFKTPLLYPLALFLFWSAISVVFALDKADSLHDLYSHLIRYLIFYLVLINLFTTKKRLLLLAACVVVSEFIFAAGGLIIYYGILKHEFVSRFFLNGFKAIAPDTIPFGFMFGLFLAVWLFKICQNRFQRSFLAVAIMVLTISTIATQSRGAFLALCLAFVVQLWDHKKILSLLVIGIVLTVVLNPMQKRILEKRFEDNPRKALILYSMEIIKDHPILGTGFSIDTFRNPDFIDKKTYLSRIPKKYRKHPFDRPHNMFLSMATRTGILGMVLYAGLFAVCTFICCRLILYGKDPFIQSISRCCLALLTMFLTNGVLQVMTTHFIDMIQYIIFALVTIIWKINKEKPDSRDIREGSDRKSMDNYFFKNITIEDKSHLFICKGYSQVVETGKIEKACLFKRQLHANIYKVNDHIIKICYGQSIPKDIFRKYALKSQAERESKSAAMLSELGLLTPKTYFSAFSIFPKMRNGVESIHEMDFMGGYDDLNPRFVYRPDCLNIIRCFGQDLAVMLNAMLCPKDLGLGNVMYHPGKDKLAWIDSDLKHFKNKETLARMVMSRLGRRFLNYLDDRQTDMFWQSFCGNSTLFAQKNELLFYGKIDYSKNQGLQDVYQKTK